MLDLTKDRRGSDLRRPPGLYGWRNSLRMGQALRTDLLQALCSLRDRYAGPERAPVAFNMAGQPALLITHPGQLHQILSDNEVFARTTKYMGSFRRALGYNIITAANDEWRVMRRRTATYFARSHLERYGEQIIEVLARRAIPAIVRHAESGAPLDLFSQMLDIASLAVFMSFLGDDIDDPPPAVYGALNRIFMYVRRNVYTFYLPPVWIPTSENRALLRDRALVQGYLRPRIPRDRERSTMFGDIIRAHLDSGGRVDERRVLDETIALLVGGSETTIILMAWALFYLVQEPQSADRVYEEIDRVVGTSRPTPGDLRRLPYLHSVINEALRLRPPAYVSSRMVAADSELGGYRVARGVMLLLCQYLTHRDPQLWSQPDSFRPERFAAGSPDAPGSRRAETVFFPFGGGSLTCVGMNYAVYEAGLMLLMLLQRFRFTPLRPTTMAEVGVDARLTLRPDRPVLLRAHMRSTAP